MSDWDGADYQRRVEATLADRSPHGEVDFVQRYAPRSVLDAGCGTGRVAIELDRRGVEVVGVDVSSSMLDTARQLAPGLTWVEADLTTVDLRERFDVVVLAGNVPLFAVPGTTAALLARCAAHVAADGVLVSGFQLDRGYELAVYDEETAAAGLVRTERYGTWDLDDFDDDADYVVSVHRRSSPTPATGARPVGETP